MKLLSTDPRKSFERLLKEADTLIDFLITEEIDRRDSMDGLGFTQEFLDCVWNIERLSDALEALSKIK